MIRIHRGQEPDAVRAARERNIVASCAAHDRYGAYSDEHKATLKDYDGGKATLYQRQHEKCAYCERRPGLSNQPLEHFRPKVEAWRHLPDDDSPRVEPGYWWLTWTWENQFFACTTCNGRGTKGNFFPLEAGAPLPQPPRLIGPSIPADSTDLFAESAMLLDPANPQVDPLDHLQWQPANQQIHPSQWTWSLKTPTDRGFWTRRILQLDRLINDVGARYRDAVWTGFQSRILPLRDAPGDARKAWHELGATLTAVEASFAAATWWQLEALRAHSDHLSMSLPRLRRPGV